MFVNSMPLTSVLSAPKEIQKVSFSGSASGYFKIWIVNLFLTVITLGIYSAWAKVRRKKYLYQNTWYAGENFDFTGNPVKILKGRIILAVMYAAFVIVSAMNSPLANLIIIGLIALAAPWIIIKSRQFNLRNTTYRGIKFNFKAGYWQAFKAFLILPVLSIITLLIKKPFELRQKGKFFINNSSFAGNNFNFNAEESRFAPIIWRVMAFFGIGIIMLVASSFYGTFFKHQSGNNGIGLIAFGIIIFYVGAIASSLYFFFACRNEYIRNSSYQQLKLYSSASGGRFIWIMVSNILLVMLSLGLLTAWATIRKHRYIVETLSTEGSLEFAGLRGQAIAAENALAEEGSDFFDLDFGI